MGKGDTSITTTKPNKKFDTLDDLSKTQAKEEIEIIEDDEFEEFEDNIENQNEDQDTVKAQWEDDWDTEQIDDEFSQQLRQEIETNSAMKQ
ncbi:DSS1/SEM1 family protein [Heterostelium album PN500]|uniref:DSS1/SEM1 family protein n=1 Tax=Heterostelium pallidum (strain ATCC 26659 / Pp 5 / PN500) TaxID=670386 RepID=D3B0K0_HETP5|nr:DSS1/SEM1 family protein [Heterostelium album PN500]EFA84824.1 DSS1/SEM1 family protein [Heterostelium album PN500]|eukprot:XP_020436935.1 DSS1/SEM1 family protein [Heterostelium album PN500]